MNIYQNKIVLVIGVICGIGLEIVCQLVEVGVYMLLVGCKCEMVVELVLKLQIEGLLVEVLQLDVIDVVSIVEVVEQVCQCYGCFDILVNNVGIMIENLVQVLLEQLFDIWKCIFDINVYVLVVVIQVFLLLIRQVKFGCIVNVLSMFGLQILYVDLILGIYDFKILVYNVFKVVVNSWILSLVYELCNILIKVNIVYLGYVKIDMNGGNGEIEISEGVCFSVEMVLIGEIGVSGSFIYLGEVLLW